MAGKLPTIHYTPPPIIEEFILDYRPSKLFYDWIIGPVGSGKTTSLFFKLCYMAGLQEPGPDGVRRTKAVIVRNTMPQLRDTTMKSWAQWFRDGESGEWQATRNIFILRFDDVECEVLFRALDTAADVERVLSLDLTFAIVDEFVQIPREIIEAVSGRCSRYPAVKDGGATNWGMWGSSNPSTEDNWWFDYLHNDLPGNARYFHQPSGLSPDAENLTGLQGGRNYYTNLATGKSEAWIKQFIEAEWGYSIAGTPVVPSFKPDLHLAMKPLMFQPNYPIVVGLDPGLKGSAMIFGQEDLHGRLLVLGELVQSGYGADRLMRERLRPYLRARFPDAQVILAPDPAAGNRAQSDERSVVDVMRKYYDVKIETNNRLPLRLDAIENYTTRLTGAGMALQVDAKECPQLVRALKGGWRYTMDTKREDQVKSAEPEKNPYSHPGDAFGYLCRYYHRQAEKTGRLLGVTRKAFVPPRQFGAAYHFR